MKDKKIIKVRSLTAEIEGRKILEDISFDVYKKDITVILGGSGSGKTTLMKHILSLYDLQFGEIEIIDQKLSEIQENELSELYLKIGVVFQNGALLNSITVGENVALPLKQHTEIPDEIIEKIVKMKLKLVNLDNSYDLYPSQLSGGMLKRASIARAIIMDPPLLFCDEPGAGLDPVSLAALDSLLLDLRDRLGVSIVMVTHEVSSIMRIADRIIFLEKGKAIYEGSLEKALSSEIPALKDFFGKGKGKK
jgi:phospholipid/cholesterol/gamma-HCH transport system ATP-binding protein